MDIIYKEITEEDQKIKRLKEEIQENRGKEGVQAMIQMGMFVEDALKRKKEIEAERISEALRKIAIQYKLNTTIGDGMFINAAFLVNRGREREFDDRTDALSEEYQDRIRFIYAGPFPPYNFANITIHLDEWRNERVHSNAFDR